MKSYATVGAVSMFAALGAAMGLLSLHGPPRGADHVDVDPITSASIPQTGAIAPPEIAAMVQFTVSNLDTDTVCIAQRGKALTGRSREFSAEPDCDTVWPGLAGARNWSENGDGSVTLTDAQGKAVLTIAAARGFDYATLEPSGVDITWLELP